MRAERETLLGKFAAAVTVLDRHFASDPDRLEDRNADAEMRGWLDGDEQPFRWAGVESTADEWFFITTLYGQEKRPQQRRRIRRYFPLFIDLTGGQIKNLIPSMIRDWTLRADWMKKRLCDMAEILRERGLAMAEYVDHLKQVEKNATPRNPMPALDTIVRDLRAIAVRRSASSSATASVATAFRLIAESRKSSCYSVFQPMSVCLSRYPWRLTGIQGKWPGCSTRRAAKAATLRSRTSAIVIS